MPRYPLDIHLNTWLEDPQDQYPSKFVDFMVINQRIRNHLKQIASWDLKEKYDISTNVSLCVHLLVHALVKYKPFPLSIKKQATFNVHDAPGFHVMVVATSPISWGAKIQKK